MAVVNFFDKAALGAAHVLQGFDRPSFLARLDTSPVGVAFDAVAATSSEGRVALELVVNLLSRLYPRLILAPDGDVATALAGELRDLAHMINPAIDIGEDLSGASVVVAVGTTPIAGDAPIVYIGSDGWIARLSPQGPVGSGTSDNSFGAAAAACFGAANIFRVLFAQQLPHGGVDEPFSLSLLDLRPNATDPASPSWSAIDLGESFLVGCGAIGNAAVWALARASGLTGTLHLIDHEPVELSNLQRYVLTGQDDIGQDKVAVAAAALAATRLEARPFPGRWGEFLRGQSDWTLDRVAVAVDNAPDRQAIQAALPRWVVNAWTQPGDLGISRHDFLNRACLTCLYMPDGPGKNEDEMVAEAIGLSDALMEVRQLLATAGPVESPLLERIADALGVPIEPLLRFEGAPLRAFYAGAICGGLVLALGGRGNGAVPQEAVPMAFQSALAGILLASELVAHAGGLRASPSPTTTKIDLLRPLGQHLSMPTAKSPTGRCICQDEAYITRYRAKYFPEEGSEVDGFTGSAKAMNRGRSQGTRRLMVIAKEPR